MPMTRRSLMALTGLGSAGTALAVRSGTAAAQPAQAPLSAGGGAHDAHYAGPVGRVPTDTFEPAVFTRTWNFSDLGPDRRPRFYREQRRPDGSLLREYDLVASDREIEIA